VILVATGTSPIVLSAHPSLSDRPERIEIEEHYSYAEQPTNEDAEPAEEFTH
jgi:hypothetical protein